MVTKEHLMLSRFLSFSLIRVCVAHHDMDDKTSASKRRPLRDVGPAAAAAQTSQRRYYYDSPHR